MPLNEVTNLLNSISIIEDGKENLSASKELSSHKTVKEFALDHEEPLLKENPNRFVIFPINYPDIFAMYKKALNSFWTVEEIDLTKDNADWKSLNSNEQHFVSHLLALLAVSNRNTDENLVEGFCNEVQLPEARFFYGFQIMVTNIHTEMYSLLIETYIKNSEEKSKLFNAIETLPYLKKKADWASEFIPNYTASYAKRVIAFTASKGIFFSGSYAVIFWFKRRGLLPGLTLSNEFITRDGRLHTEFACLMFKHLVNKPSNIEITEIITEAVLIEQEFLTNDLPLSLIGMNGTLMKQYIEFVADHLLIEFGCEKVYNVVNPFDFVEGISLDDKCSSFENNVGELKKSGGIKESKENTFKFDDAF